MADNIFPPAKPQTTNHDEVWSRFKKFYSKNEKMLEKCVNMDVKAAGNDKVFEIEHQIDSFSETMKIVLDGLAELGKIHPIIGAAVVAFHAVVSLDLTRRENDRKVVVILVEMQNMMCAMFQLRHLTHAHVDDNERQQDKLHLNKLVRSITGDITQCGSDINYYLSQKFVLRMVKAWDFEARFKDHVATFAQRRSELQTTITAYIAGGVDHTNFTLAAVTMKVDDLASKLEDMFHTLMRRLDTPLERQTKEFFSANGGITNCVAQDNLLVRLLTLAGDVIPESGGGEKGEDKVTKSRRILQEELQKDFVESLKQNTLRFESLLKVQDNNHERVMARFEKQEGYQRDTVSKLDQVLLYMHPETRLNDPELQRIWDDMGLKTSVKAKHFVLTFRDHYQQTKPQAMPVPVTSSSEQPLTTAADSGGSDSADAEDSNAWLLQYIDVAHVRPIVEAIDADSSGFISVKEINTFARSKPPTWSFLQWMVYWAAGWHLNVLRYRDKIYDVLIKMHELVPLIHPANQYYVNRYLYMHVINHIEAILRFTKDVGADGRSPKLRELALSYADIQEATLMANLQEMSYIISSPADANLVAGGARVETWIYPLLHLLLSRHLDIMSLAKSHILHEDEMETHTISLHNLLILFSERSTVLQAIFSQVHQNVAGRFETFAYGMFYASYNKDTEISPAKSTLTKARAKATRQNIILASPTKTVNQDGHPDLSILAHDKQPSFEFELLNVHSTFDMTEDPISHPFAGYWCGVCFYEENVVFAGPGLLHFILSVAPDGTVSGAGESFTGAVGLSGHVSLIPTNDPLYDVDLQMSYATSSLISFVGVYDAERDKMHGTWAMGAKKSIPDTAVAGASSVIIQDSTEAAHDKEGPPGQSAECTEDAPSQGVDPVEVAYEINTQTRTASTHDGAGDDSDTSGEPDDDSDTEEGEKEEQFSDSNTQAIEGERVEVGESGRFSFTRTPAEVFKYRAHIYSEGTSPSLGRRRWIFAIEAVRYQVQAKRFSWDYVRKKIAERKLWVSLNLKFFRSLLAVGEGDTLVRVTGEYHPAEGRLYEIISAFLDDRLYGFAVGRGTTCDSCKNIIIVSRFRCITCMKENLSNQIDLCTDGSECIASSTTNVENNFVHIPSHTLLRSNYFIHNCDLAALISLCRTRSDDVKRRYRALEESKKATKRNAKSSKLRRATEAAQKDESPALGPLICVCCEQRISLPCWVCAICAVDTAICLDCERARAIVKLSIGGNNSRPHSHDHLLLRIHDNKEINPGEVNNAQLQQELSNITADLRSLEQKVTDHLKSAGKVNGVLQALAEINPNFKSLVLDAADALGHDDIFSDILSDNFTNTEDPISAALSPSPFNPSELPVPSAHSTEPAVAAGEIATSVNHLEDELVDDATPGVAERSTIIVVGAGPPMLSVLPENGSTVTDTPIPSQFSSPAVVDSDPPVDHLSELPPNQGRVGTRMKSTVLNSRLDALDKRISDLEKAVDGRFSGLESQMGEMLALLRNISHS